MKDMSKDRKQARTGNDIINQCTLLQSQTLN